ncbi:E3 ubiquitin-protein ligase rnf213-alpha-like [Haliotis asinina]|uniref:E3 ubiquitin-protein ligase rnf213-alpha-like n=1 Tax=Haliotis asinina TaxID=109174 RepID=UPI0035323760
MKCSGTDKDGSRCSYESDERFYFCPKCGSGCSEDQSTTKKSIQCPGKSGACGTDLAADSDANFCFKCGWEIDKSLFVSPKICPGELKGAPCGAEVKEGSNFCGKCGLKLFSDDTITGQASDTTARGLDSNDNARTTNNLADHGRKKQRKKKKKKKQRVKHEAKKESADSNSTGDSDDDHVSEDPSESEYTTGNDQAVDQTRKETDPVSRAVGSSPPNDQSKVSVPQQERECHKNVLQSETTQPGTKSNILQPIGEHSSQQEMRDDTIPTEGQASNTTARSLDSNDNARTTNNLADHGRKKQRKKKKKKKQRVKHEAKKESADRNSTGDSDDDHVSEDPSESEYTTRNDQMIDQTRKETDPVSRTVGSSSPNDQSKVSVPQQERERHKNVLQNVTTQPRTESNIPQPIGEHSSQQEMRDDTIPTGTATRSSDGTESHGASCSGVTTRQMARAQENGNSGVHKMSYSEAAKQKPEVNQVNTGNKRSGQEEPMVDVIFHVLLSEEMNVNHSTDKVTIQFGSELLKGWQIEHWELKFVRVHHDHVYEYECCVPMTQGLRNKGFEYKYKVKHSKKDSRPIWETVHYLKRQHLAGNDPNRHFNFPEYKRKDVSPWHQYDGFVYPKMSENLLQKLWSKAFGGGLQGRIRHDVMLAGELFLPSAKSILTKLIQRESGETSIVEEDLDKIGMMYTGLSIQMVDKNMDMLDKDLSVQMFQKIMDPLIDHLVKFEKNFAASLVLSVFILSAYSENKIPFKAEGMNRDFLKNLMMRPDSQQSTVEGFEALRTHFPKRSSKTLARTVLKMMEENSSVTSHTVYLTLPTYKTSCADSSWLYLVPLLHFLREDSKPMLKYSTNHTDDTWWGIKNIERHKEKLKICDQWITSEEEIFRGLYPYFEADFLLPRTLMSCVSLWRLKKVLDLQVIPPEICTATLFYYCKSSGSFLSHDTKKYLTECFLTVAKQFKDVSGRRETELDCTEHRYICVKIAADLLDVCLADTYQSTRFLLAAVDVFTSSISVCECHNESGSNPVGGEEEVDNPVNCLLDEKMKQIITWMNRYFSRRNTSNIDLNSYISLWNNLITLQVNSPPLAHEWKTTLLDAFEQVLFQVCPETCLNLHRSQIDKPIDRLLQERMTSAAFRSFDLLMKKDDQLARDIQMDKAFCEMVSKHLQMYWPENPNEEKLIQHVITWRPLISYFSRFIGDPHAYHLLVGDCAQHLMEAVSLLDKIAASLLNGDISVWLLKLILTNKKNFTELWAASRQGVESHISMEHTLHVREKELQACQVYLKRAHVLLILCADISEVNTDELSNRVREMEERIDTNVLCALCHPLQEFSALEGSLDSYQPTICISEIPEKIMAMVPRLEKLNESLIFREMWRREGTSIAPGTKFEEAVLKVWQKSSQRWSNLCKKVQDGTETFSNIQEHVRIFQGDEIKITKEFQVMSSGSPDWIPKRIQQLRSFEILQGCQRAAEIIMSIKEIYSMEGNFAPVEAVRQMGSGKDHPINTMDDSVLETCSILHDMNDPQKQRCIEAFENSSRLVNWLRESMKDGVKELKVFVDLAFISAGEEPMEIHKVNCFHSATTGYAPLIFNTPKNADYDTFLRNCELVWQELRSDEDLPNKLSECSRFWSWLKEVKKSHGSVEVTSLTQAGQINNRGMYRIGNLDDIQNCSLLTLNNVISLHVTQDKDQNLSRKYSYSQLVDLQSRLMLVAGQAEKGKENMDHFTMVLDGIVRLARTYIRLCIDGCVLFNCWKGKFLCGDERNVCTFLEFGEGENLETLKGHRGKEDVDVFIHSLANEFEEFHDEWMNYVSEKRNEYLELNFYTIEQLVFLQRELIKLGTDEQTSVHVYSMLSLIKPDCTESDLGLAMKSAREVVFAKKDRKETEIEDIGPETDQDVDTKQVFIDAMKTSNFSEKLARQALEEVNPEDIDSGIAWCMEHEDDFREEEEGRESSVDPLFMGWQAGGESVSSIATSWVKSISHHTKNKTTVQDLTLNLRSVWKTFLEAVSSSVADYLSLEHLGIILRQLAQSDERTFNRTIPPPLKPGISNLIVCPQADMLNTVVYMYKHSEDQPLPQPDEVLLCTQQTTFDQVDIFLRRAFFNNSGKLYTMASADLLQYEIEERAEKKLKEYSNRDKDFDCQLVILCSTENEFKARIVAALERQRCPPPALQNLHDVKKYLLLKFSQKVECNQDHNPASNLDFSSSTVRVIKSKRAGVGKTLYKKRQVEALQRLNPRVPATSVSIHLYEKTLSTTAVAEKLLDHTLQPGQVQPRIFHLDISYEVQEGVDYLLFNLLILGCISNNMGHVWLKSPLDLYLVETIPITDVRQDRRVNLRLIHALLEVLPDVHCWSPQDSLQILKTGIKPEEYGENDSLFDNIEFEGETYQRPFQYLKRWNSNKGLTNINPQVPEGTHEECLTVLLQHCGVMDPSWSELHNFVWFLNTQLVDFEKSDFCSNAVLEDLPGFPVFVLKFLIQMSRDFATRSLVMSEQTPLDQLNVQETVDLAQFQMKRKWESSPHPYIFFNPDGNTMTFLGFNIDRQTGNMVDQQTGRVLEKNLVPKPLQKALTRNRVNMNENFDQMQRHDRLAKLCSVMPGVDFVHDPDETYELTTDNVKKILAIYMRFKCGIPVIIMGETGCGKTRLVKFMCDLQCLPGSDIQNMVIVKVHGGTTSEDLIKKVGHAEKLATANKAKNPHMYTVLFFDEANTTEAIGLIKEIMCDGTMDGQPLKLSENLKIVAACNPYRKHSDEYIQRLEKAGLGYHVEADKTTDKLGHVPMRRLVYRVQPLPQSMLPLVWDFGQLNVQVEELYIRQMVNRYVRNGQTPAVGCIVPVVSKILISSQSFMRRQQDECSFVSLRDVDRTLSVMAWFYQQSQENGMLFRAIDNLLSLDQHLEEVEESQHVNLPDDVTKSLILALSVCYRASLTSREEYDRHMCRHFQNPCAIPGGFDQMVQVINSCQDVFVDKVQLEENIAKNQALKENLFMMVVCIELRIPLFLVGKPGSSKSLAKTIVADAMQGNSARSELFKQLKQAQMVSFQCSPLATAEGIVGTFRQCARYQQDKDLDRFASIVVLDEVGLAEDSPRMPLKTLHPLLEDGCQGDEKPEPYKKVAFIGISNWALDPAKMNRGILVQREVPDDGELVKSAQGICSSSGRVLRRIKPLLPMLANAYTTIFNRAQNTKREFFGLRDFYSLVKMVYAFADKHDRDICWHQLEHAVKRNFGGLDNLDPVVVFKDKITTVQKQEQKHDDDPESNTIQLIEAGLSTDVASSESRYLLLLTENYGALSILQQEILARHKVIVIFGSSFPKDQEYTQVCRNINRIKVCMETGSTVILLNLENLYESLYDALNQYYARLGGERFVDLGLGTHRVKCRVHQKFKLIVVAEKQKVYDEFPIPLINRLEKHFLDLNNMMTPEQKKLAEELNQWAVDFITARTFTSGNRQRENLPEDAFMGYHPDTAAAIVIQVWGRDHLVASDEDIFRECQEILLWCATPASVERLADQKLHLEAETIHRTYWQCQQHDDIYQYLKKKILEMGCSSLQAQVTTHSKLLTDQEKEDLGRHLTLTPNNIILLTLQSFDTEQQFAQQIKNFVQRSEEGQKLLLVQCGSGDRNQSLIRSAQYCVLDELHDARQFAVVFIIQLPNIAGGCFSGFQAGKWHSLHLDELRQSTQDMPSMNELHKYSPASIFEGLRSNVPPTSVQPLEQRMPTIDLLWEEPVPDQENLNMQSVSQEHQEAMPMFLEQKHRLYPRQEGPGAHGDLLGLNSSQNVSDRRLGLSDVYWGEVSEKHGGDVVGIEDVEVEIVERKQSIAPYFQKLLLPCIQSAAALIRDEELDTKRSTKRIEILLKLLDNTNDEESRQFMTGLSQLIICLLKEKEQLYSRFLPSNWLAKEAAQQEHVRQAGTFRRAASQCLENKIIPILAGVVAFLDTNRNLDLCLPGEAPWKRRLWLALLDNTKVCHYQCKNIIAPENQHRQGEVVPHHLGVNKQVFPVQMPFFWLLYQDIRNAIAEAENTGQSVDEDSTELLTCVSDLISKTAFGEVLSSVVEEEEKTFVFKAYLRDFLHTIYPGNMDVWEVLSNALENAARQTDRDLCSLDVTQAIIYIHIIHSAAKERLQLFLEVVQIWPDVVTAVTVLKERVGGNPLLTDDEMTLDVLSIVILMEQLEPSKEELNTVTGRVAWMDRVKTYLPVIGRILNTTDTQLAHGLVCLRAMDQVRCGWMRVMVIKLFLESFSSNKKVQLESRCMPLWTMLTENADLKKMESLKKIELFLKSVNKNVVKKLSGKVGSCSHCETEFEAPPVELPCKDKICLRCFNESQVTRDLICPKCHTAFPETFTPGSGPSQQVEMFTEYQEYLKCCNSFLMSVVSKLCFGGTETPESAVIERIFSYITRRYSQSGRLHTKEMSVFDDMIDPTPVVRSFLLKLLIHKSEELVQNYLQNFFHDAKAICQQGKEEMPLETLEEIVQFSLLVIQCFEDLYYEHGSQTRTSSEEMQAAGHKLSDGRRFILYMDLDLRKMFTIAMCRYGLSVTAKYLHAVFIDETEKMSTDYFRELLGHTEGIVTVKNAEWPKKFLVKQICREFGTDSYQAICDTGKVPWLALDVTDKVSECPDRYIVCLEYQQVRETLAKTLLGEDIKHLEQLVKKKEMLFLLAIHREVTMSNIKPQTERDQQMLKSSLEMIAQFVQNGKEVTQKELAQSLLKNEFGGPGSPLNVTEGQGVRDQSLICLLLHTYLVLTQFNNKPGFLKPLSDLILHPEDMKDMLLPTMPQDDVDSIRQVMMESLKAKGDSSTVVFFRCPDGHPYAITECGRPYTEGTCNKCGKKIGGRRHEAFEGNTRHGGEDQTQPGHVLGRAADRTVAYPGERQLGGPSCAVLRFFTHAALLLGTRANPEAVANLAKPPLEQDVSQFFLEHLQKDLQIIHMATGKSVDDVFLLLHFICHQMTQLETQRDTVPQTLSSKKAREAWEEKFAKVFILPLLQNLDSCLIPCNERMLKDKRIGQDKLMSLLYEVDNSIPQEVDCLHEFPAVWRYRSRITLEHFLREFQLKVENIKGRKSKMEVLRLFREQHPYLQVLHHIPNILQLQQSLMAKYRRRLDRKEAQNVSIAEIATDGNNSVDVLKYLPDFIAAWNCVKEGLHSHGCWTVHDGLIHLPDAYKNMTIDENSPLAVLLPSTQGPGICSYMMLEFLLRKHNEFMESYCEKTSSSYERLPEVSMRKLHSNHLVSYHPDRDLLPLVLANCNYSFELGKGTTIEYDFEGFEYQLKEVILQAKSRVEQKSHVIPIDTMVFRADTTNAIVFKTLRDKIPQVSLTPAVKLQICSGLKSSLPDICDSINNLDITTSFLKSLGGEPDKSLQTFMTEVLKMKQTITSQKARQFCRFKHIQSLWLLLSFEKSRVLAQNAQDAFDYLDTEFKRDLPEEARTELKRFCQKKSPDKMECLLQAMFDCLLLRVAQPVDPYDEDAVDMKSMSLRDILQGDRDAPLYSKEPDDTLTDEDILTFPAVILGKHIPDSWLSILRELEKRRKEFQ